MHRQILKSYQLHPRILFNRIFPSNTVEEVEKNNNRQIWEDENGNIIEIESHNITIISLSALPVNITSHLQESHPNLQVVGWKKTKKNKKVKLTNDIELEFDTKGNFRKID